MDSKLIMCGHISLGSKQFSRLKRRGMALMWEEKELGEKRGYKASSAAWC